MNNTFKNHRDYCLQTIYFPQFHMNLLEANNQNEVIDGLFLINVSSEMFTGYYTYKNKLLLNRCILD